MAVTGHCLLRGAHQRCMGACARLACPLLLASQNTNAERWHPWILSRVPQGATNPFASLPLSPFSLVLCPISGPAASLLLLISPHSCSAFPFLLSSLLWTPTLPPSCHTSDSSPLSILQPPPERWNNEDHKRVVDTYWQFLYPETLKYKVSKKRGFREILPTTHSLVISFSDRVRGEAEAC